MKKTRIWKIMWRYYLIFNEISILINMESYNAILIKNEVEWMTELRKFIITQLIWIEKLNNDSFKNLEDKLNKQYFLVNII